ncbi:hypothetical protein DL770_004508 [Monosporascus sp. CRB-9-2]|nr:hypothetical protein DL770_004508 [Monosporascus sp. CRB-9-2]
MARRLLFTVFALVPGVRAGDDLSDFSNNLATDLGPLLALFGDSITVQYLSESTSFLDYFIFAMAPIGIITAVVSTIRVCGSPSLRAFIGRSQEGDATIEAALCTSTSRDVCEMFNKGGITRVLGRPSILELVHNPSRGRNENLNLFRSYLESASVSCEWGRTTRPAGTQSGRWANTETLAPTPNLSLNVGIIQRPRWVYFVVAGIGFILQSFTLALAGVGVWVLDWTLREDSGTAARNYAPSMFIIGTIMLSMGMWSCAALIGQTTHEIRFERQGPQESWLSQLIWLQPGPQVIGDQSFDSFAVFEQEGKPLKVWTSSTKDLTKKYEAHAWVAISMVLLGYIMQFIGIRGMQAWISLTQLGNTVIMSFLRGMLRAKRLNKNDNALRDMPDLVASRELDWLTFELVKRSAGKPGPEHEPYWQFNGCYRNAREQSDNSISQKGPGLGTQSPLPDGDVEQAARFQSANMGSQRDVLNCQDMLSIRTRLAHLTGHTSMSSLSNGQYQAWKDDYVAARKNAQRLSSAICMAAKSIHTSRRPKRYELCIQVSSRLYRNGISPEHGPIEVFIPLWSPQNSQRSTWQIDSAMLESVLGLWMWALLYNAQSLAYDDFGNQVSRAEEVKRVRIVAADALQKPDTQPELNLWLSPDDDVKFDDGILTLPHNADDDGLSGLWSCDLQEERWNLQTQAAARLYPGTRFCGWSLVYEALAARTAGSANASPVASNPAHARGDVQIQYVRTEQSLLDVCTQELFTALLMSLILHTGAGETTVVESSGHVRLKNPVVDSFAKAFTESNLGSHSEALLCIIPALGEHGRPSQDRLLGALFKEAETYRKQSEWERAETLLRWACEYCDEHSYGNFTTESLRAIGELYRWSLASYFTGDTMSDERRRFGVEGIEWMQNRYGQAQAAGIREILDDYQYVRVAIGILPPRKEVAMKELMQAIGDRKRKDALHWLCFFDARSFYPRDLNAALPLAVRNGWDEVVLACLELKADIDGQDEEGRTALSYSAELGSERWTKRFTELGARLELDDKDHNTPLSWAAATGNVQIVRALLNTRQVNPDARNRKGQTPLWLAAEKGHDATVQLLVETGANTEAKDDQHRQTPLCRAIEHRRESILRLLLQNGADKEVETNGQTPISRAAEIGNEAAVRLLLESGANPEAKFSGDTPMTIAVKNGHTAVVERMLKNSVNTETRSWDGTPLILAAKNGHEDVARVLLENGANAEATQLNTTPLGFAAENGHETIVRLLLERKADTENGSYYGTPVYKAARKGHDQIVRILLENGANIEGKQEQTGETPLQVAAVEGKEAVVRVLLEKGADIHHKNDSGSTALWKATWFGHEAIVRLLFQHGAGTELDSDTALQRYLDITKMIGELNENRIARVEEEKDEEAAAEKREELHKDMERVEAAIRVIQEFCKN